jgi:hypothetical protein
MYLKVAQKNALPFSLESISKCIIFLYLFQAIHFSWSLSWLI